MSARKAARPYHHGDLRSALVEAALAVLREAGPDALTLRAVARRAGVSQTAPYRHFADRTALVAAVAESGFRALHAAILAEISKADPGTRKGLQAIALAYVRFALDRPAEYRVMFGPEAADRQRAPGLADASNEVFELLRGGIAFLQGQGLVRRGDAMTMAVSAWALVHGIVMLALDGLAPVGDARPAAARRRAEALATSATELLMFGMAAERPRGGG